jgi:ATP synthase, F1 gamma subunit
VLYVEFVVCYRPDVQEGVCINRYFMFLLYFQSHVNRYYTRRPYPGSVQEGTVGMMLGKFYSLVPLHGQHQVRGMATLKAISIRLKSVKNIQKITQSMKMVSAAKYTRAERELKQARPYGEGAKVFYEKAEVAPVGDVPQKLIVAVTSDRGLCGAVHTQVSRTVKQELAEDSANTKIVCVGDKSRAILQRLYGKNIIFVASEVGRKPPTFLDASKLANAILTSGYDFTSGRIVYNRFRSVVSYATTDLPLFSLKAIEAAPKLNVYDSLDADVLLSYMEFSLASLLFYAFKEGACSEQSSRMTAMDNASKNAAEMIDKLTLTFNRTRQAVITRELIEIISGAAALE